MNFVSSRFSKEVKVCFLKDIDKQSAKIIVIVVNIFASYMGRNVFWVNKLILFFRIRNKAIKKKILF